MVHLLFGLLGWMGVRESWLQCRVQWCVHLALGMLAGCGTAALALEGYSVKAQWPRSVSTGVFGTGVGNWLVLGFLLGEAVVGLIGAARWKSRGGRKQAGRRGRTHCGAQGVHLRMRNTAPENFEESLMRALRVARGEWMRWEEASGAALGPRPRKPRRLICDRVSVAVREAERTWMRHQKRTVGLRHKNVGTVRADLQEEKKRDKCEGAAGMVTMPSKRTVGPCVTPVSAGAWNGRKQTQDCAVVNDRVSTKHSSCGKDPVESTDKICAWLGTLDVSEQDWLTENDPGAWLVG